MAMDCILSSSSSGGHPPSTYSSLRERLDEMGYFQGFLPECLPLVEALFNDLLTTTHNLKIHKDKLKTLPSQHEEENNKSFSRTSKDSEITKESSCSSSHPALLLEYERREEDHCKKIRDLESLNAHAASIISSLQSESLEKSKKIAKLEAFDKARISEGGNSVYNNRPRMEITSYIKKSSSKGKGSLNKEEEKKKEEAQENLDIVKMYERKNEIISGLLEKAESEVLDLRAQLLGAQDKKAALNKSRPEANPKSSSYISKILKDNSALREKIAVLEKSKGASIAASVSNKPGSPVKSACHRLHHAHHNQAHEINKENMKGDRASRHIEDQHLHIHELEDQLRTSQEEIRELKRRLSHLQSSKKSFKDKVDTLQAQQRVLFNSKESSSKMKELVSFMEKQRNLYRDNVHELLDELDPGSRRARVSVEEVPVREGLCAGCKRKKQMSKERSERKEVEEEEIERSDPLMIKDFRENILILQREKEDLIGRLEDHRREIREKESMIESTKSKMEEWRSRALSASSQGVLEQSETTALSQQLRSLRDQVTQLENDLRIKNSHLKSLSEEKDEAVRLLDEKTLRLEKMKSEHHGMLNDLQQLDTEKAATDDRVSSVMSQMNSLQLEMKSHARSKEEFRGLYEREKAVCLQLRRENNDLRNESEAAFRDKDEALTREMDIKAHIQKYICEVKRIEELLAICERERSTLLEQYKYLSSDVSTSEVLNQKLETKVTSLELSLKEKEIEMNAAESRIRNLEKDLAEMSLSNENYRLQLASFTVRADLAESELKEARHQQSWINNDLSSVHELAVTLNSQKVELINKISEQETEINDMNREIDRLKSEIEFLRKEHFEEKRKAKALQEKLSASSQSSSSVSS